ncbi:MAG TPA: hypothetical protein DEA08_07985 [Planctomycetes bacterium]|nr:hypothetical protein [Planctomycetota bacterium]
MNGSNGGPFEEDKAGRSDLTKKILTLGLGAYFLTEDTVRRYVKDAKLPRDIGKTITQNATKGKDELYGFVARELSGFLRQMDLQAELDRFVRSHKIRINAEIEFVPRPGEEGAEEGEDEDLEAAEGEEASGEAGPIEWNVKFKAPRPPEPVDEPSAEEDELD